MGKSNFTEADMIAMGLVKHKDGLWGKPITTHPALVSKKPPVPKKVITETDGVLRKITINLFGIPMAKQSARFTKTGHSYQPKKMIDKSIDYVSQIKSQLPAGFVIFSHIVHVVKFHVILPPLKSFQKIKGRMDAIRNGEIFYKNTRPDLPDNYKKLALDSLSGIVYADDGLIVSEDNVKKYYGLGGCIIIELEGY